MPKRTVVAVANEKGGAAKTTTAVNAAAALGAAGHQVLVIDLDHRVTPAAGWVPIGRGPVYIRYSARRRIWPP